MSFFSTGRDVIIFGKKRRTRIQIDNSGHKTEMIGMGRHKKVLYHRLVWFMHYGVWPEKNIDHINGDSLDNRIENLRDISASGNMRNKACHRNGTTLGVTKHSSGRWQAQRPKCPTHGNCRRYIGLFPTQTEAANAVIKAMTLCGDTDIGSLAKLLPLKKEKATK